MDWQYTLIDIFVFVCRQFDDGLGTYCQRLSNNRRPSFTDEEITAIYLFGIIQGRFTVKSIYDYTRDHLLEWFPELPSYQGFNLRLNRLAPVFEAMINSMLEAASPTGLVESVKLIDSLPVMLAQRSRSTQARVARDMADKGYCSSKSLYFHGLKLHVLATHNPGTLPRPEVLTLSPASAHDLTVARPIIVWLRGCSLYGDKIYSDDTLKEDLEKEQAVLLHTPVKRKKRQLRLHFDQALYSQAVSRVRQPIESLFNWINEKTGIEIASKVRSTKGLMVHVFGKLAAAIYMLLVNS